MLSEFTSSKVFAANLTLNHDHGATLFDVFSKFRTSQSLEFLQVANIATVFEALIVLGMLLKITNSLPDSMCISIALMWKLTIINAISHDWIDFLQKVSLYLATRTANFMSSNNVPWAVWSSLLLVVSHHSHCLGSSSSWRAGEFITTHSVNVNILLGLKRVFVNLYLAILAENFVAMSALERHIWKSIAHNTRNFLDQLDLQVILNLFHLDANLRNWIGAHDLIYRFVWDN